MQRPNLDIAEIGKLLKERGIYYLYHANAVETSLTYLQKGALLSRQYCISKSLPQTYQKSDPLDQKYGIFDDLFFNLDDQHLRFKKPNEYGPVLFHIHVGWFFDFLESAPDVYLNITRKNPHKWLDSDSMEDRWLLSTEEVDGLFLHGRNDPRKFYRKGGVWPDFVLSGLSEGLPLETVSKVWLEQPPQIPDFIEQFQAKAGVLTSSFSTDQISYREQCAAAGCACCNSDSFEKPNIKPKLSFGAY